MSPVDLPKIYNPALQSKQELIENFVVRAKLFRDIFDDIKKSKMQHPEQHYIIQGNRGQGKTTMLLRIAYEIKNDPKLSKRMIPVIFNEEQYSITKLFKLWESIAEHLDEGNEINGLYEKMQELDYDDDYEFQCFELLEKTLIENKKKLILFIDNIDEMFEKFSKKEHHRLREVFMESAEIRVIGASSVSLEFHHDYGKPFYHFFKMPYLKGLTTAETKKLLLGLGRHYKKDRVNHIVKNQPGRIEALRRLTGGIIRTIIILFEIFVDDENGNAFKDLEKILDSVTPLYKHRMDKLSAQQQEIVDFIALKWDAVTTKEIAKKTRIQSKAVSAQLGQLEKFHIIEKEKTNTKNYLYRIHERFFNIWYLMRLGRKWDERRVRFIVEFLQIWCDEKELESRAHRHLDALKLGKIVDRHALFMTEALIRTPIKMELQSQLLKNTRIYLENNDSELCGYLSKCEERINEKETKDISKPELVKKMEQLEQKEKKTPDELNTLGIFYITVKKDFKQAEDYFLQSVHLNNIDAMNNLGMLYIKGPLDLTKAKDFFHQAALKGNAEAMNNLGLLYVTGFKNYQKAKDFFQQALEKGNVEAMYNQGVLNETEFKDYQKAKEYYLMAAEKGHDGAMFNLGALYKTEFNDYKKAEEYYLLSVEQGNVEAMNNLGLLYAKEFKNNQKAKEFFQQGAEKGYAEAMSNLGVLYVKEFKDNQKAIELFQQGVEKGHAESMNKLAMLYAMEFKDYKKAEEYYLKAVGKGHTDAMNNLAFMYFQQKKNKAQAIDLSEKAYQKKNRAIYAHTHAMILLWGNQFKEGLEVAENFLNNKEFLEGHANDVNQFLMLLIAKKQYHLLLNIFNENPHKFKDRFKPVYYALMSFMKDEYPNEYLKMGGELKETVDEIIIKINEMEKAYQ